MLAYKMNHSAHVVARQRVIKHLVKTVDEYSWSEFRCERDIGDNAFDTLAKIVGCHSTASDIVNDYQNRYN